MTFGRPIKYVRLTDIEDSELDGALTEANSQWKD